MPAPDATKLLTRHQWREAMWRFLRPRRCGWVYNPFRAGGFGGNSGKPHFNASGGIWPQLILLDISGDESALR
jgi:hypothetical protein